LLAHFHQGSGFRVQGSGFRVQGTGFRVQGPGDGVTLAEAHSITLRVASDPHNVNLHHQFWYGLAGLFWGLGFMVWRNCQDHVLPSLPKRGGAYYDARNWLLGLERLGEVSAQQQHVVHFQRLSGSTLYCTGGPLSNHEPECRTTRSLSGTQSWHQRGRIYMRTVVLSWCQRPETSKSTHRDQG